MRRCPELHLSCHFPGGVLEEGRRCRGPGEMRCEVGVQLTRISAAGRREASLLALPTLLLRAGRSCQGTCAGRPGPGRRYPGQQRVGRRTSPRSAKAGGILELLRQRFSDNAELRRGQGLAAGGVTVAATEEGTVGWGPEPPGTARLQNPGRLLLGAGLREREA